MGNLANLLNKRSLVDFDLARSISRTTSKETGYKDSCSGHLITGDEKLRKLKREGSEARSTKASLSQLTAKYVLEVFGGLRAAGGSSFEIRR